MPVNDTGLGVPLVLLHAFPLDSRMWDPVRDTLAAQARVITPDQRGLGRTPLGAEPPSLEVVARDVLGLLDQLGLDRVVLGGCSMGGYVAMALLRLAPERVSGLVLVDTKAVADTPEQRANRLAMAARIEAEGVDWLPDTVIEGLLGQYTHSERPRVVAAVRRLIADQSAEGVAWAQRAMAARPDSTATLAAVTVPTLVLTGREDALIPPALASAMAGVVPSAVLTQLPRSGHLPSLETPAEFSAAVLEFLRATG
ncbi:MULTISPECIES: alpha/beta fold hydrolase [unclassified Crossiella]|uniref:alpha/beta fold hydrolase n=1 Tax=unclassified Crossiella TaxID=2620835 RepID=UPI001FFFB8C4|nr:MULTISPECIES: alpha/beta fold hydrolase [unclassified Crossiella]MCK2244879.1 alpha/beta hydrolase [Crossiella sp. S99.2]MCK2258568.1 alpha/beta hydrolase [Crossiella sp. S99.1]